jgi:hypothetical protein
MGEYLPGRGTDQSAQLYAIVAGLNGQTPQFHPVGVVLMVVNPQPPQRDIPSPGQGKICPDRMAGHIQHLCNFDRVQTDELLRECPPGALSDIPQIHAGRPGNLVGWLAPNRS